MRLPGVNHEVALINFQRVESMMQQGVASGVFPGAVLLVACQGKVVHHQAYGFADLFSRRKMTLETVFDLSSLTKPLATTLAVMRLVRENRLDLASPLAVLCPELQDSDKSGITSAQLLSHCAGLPAWQPYFMQLRHFPLARRTPILRQWLLKEALAYAPGRAICYSDIGFLLLQWGIEMLAGVALGRYVSQAIYRALGIKEVFAQGLADATPARFAATELCPWRKRLLLGEVHDDNAFVLGGLSAHAGLFGTARGVFELLNILLQAEHDQQGRAFLDSKLVRAFFTRQPGSTWALGFDTPACANSSAGVHFSPDTIGHLGFTGASFWADRQQEIIVVLLTNRVHPSRFNTSMRAFRPALHDMIMETVKRQRGPTL